MEDKYNNTGGLWKRKARETDEPGKQYPDYDGSKPTSHLPYKDFDYSIVKHVLTEVDNYVKKGTERQIGDVKGKEALYIHPDLITPKNLEKKVEHIHKDITDGQKSLTKVIIGTAGTIIAAVLSIVVTILLKM